MTHDDQVDLTDIFTNESYEEREFRAGEHTLRLLCSPSASTDYDLTGQIMWPAAQLLADYLAANPAIMQGCRCALELGSGLGFPGILAAKVVITHDTSFGGNAAQFCPVILTDHNAMVMRVLQRNADLNKGPHAIRCMTLDWGADSSALAKLLLESPGRQGFDLLLGSDVAYSLKALPSLFTVAARLMSKKPESVFLLGYVSRGIFLEAAAAGLRTREVPGTSQSAPGGLEGAVYEIRWAHLAAPAAAAAQQRSAWAGLGPGQSGLIAAACLGPLLAGLAASYYLSK